MRRRSSLAVGLVLLVAVGVLGLAGLAALSAADALQRAQDRLATASNGQTGAEQTVQAVAAAQEDVTSARDSLSAWPVDVLAAVPVLGRSWRAERAVARTAQAVLSGATVLADGLPRVRAGGGGVDLTALEQVREDLAAPAREASRAVSALRATPVGLTPSPVQTGVRQAEDRLGSAADGLQKASDALGVLAGVLGGSGSRSVLVMLQNNAELRGTGGYSASFALGRLEAGRLELGPLRDVAAAGDPPEQARLVPAPEEYLEDYGDLDANATTWRSWNLSPHVPDSALVGARIAGAVLPEQPDLVLLLDVPALGAVAELGGGPVVLPDGTSIDAAQLTQALLVDAYAAAGAGVPEQLARRAALQQAATAAVTRLVSGDVPAAEAARTVARLASQRHLAIWSAQPQEQEALVRLGAAGAVEAPADGDLSHVSVNNVGANKLDQYVRREVEVQSVLSDGEAVVTQRVRFTNEAPADLVPYVAGFERPGRVISFVELSLPPAAELLTATVDDEQWVGTRNSGAARQRLRTRIEIPRGDSAVLLVRYRLPVAGEYRLRLLPQPLVTDARLTLVVGPADGYRLGRVRGAEVSGEAVSEAGDFTAARDLSVEVLPPPRSRWQRFVERWRQR